VRNKKYIPPLKDGKRKVTTVAKTTDSTGIPYLRQTSGSFDFTLVSGLAEKCASRFYSEIVSCREQREKQFTAFLNKQNAVMFEKGSLKARNQHNPRNSIFYSIDMKIKRLI
jgi:hypothetical protein